MTMQGEKHEDRASRFPISQGFLSLRTGLGLVPLHRNEPTGLSLSLETYEQVPDNEPCLLHVD